MPPRFAYWTIIVEGKPTAFRAQLREELEPTFKQLHNKHPDAVMMWFARGRLWASPEEARAAEPRGGAERRKPDWRPGGEHRDPRARFDIPRDVKRRRFAEKLRRESPGGFEGPPRGETFVTRTITRAVAAIEQGLQEKLHLGNLNAERAWGHARDFVEGMWMILQQ